MSYPNTSITVDNGYRANPLIITRRKYGMIYRRVNETSFYPVSTYLLNLALKELAYLYRAGGETLAYLTVKQISDLVNAYALGYSTSCIHKGTVPHV